MKGSRIERVAWLALLGLVLAVSAPAGEVAPEPVPEPEAAPAPVQPTEPGLVLVSRVGAVFASTFFRPPVEELTSLSRVGEAAEGSLPVAFALGRVTPNPLFGVARLGFDLPVASRVTCEVLDVAGRVMQTLVDGAMGPGRHSLLWEARGAAGGALSPGIYFMRREARAVNGSGGIRRVDKVLVLR